MRVSWFTIAPLRQSLWIASCTILVAACQNPVDRNGSTRWLKGHSVTIPLGEQIAGMSLSNEGATVYWTRSAAWELDKRGESFVVAKSAPYSIVAVSKMDGEKPTVLLEGSPFVDKNSTSISAVVPPESTYVLDARSNDVAWLVLARNGKTLTLTQIDSTGWGQRSDTLLQIERESKNEIRGLLTIFDSSIVAVVVDSTVNIICADRANRKTENIGFPQSELARLFENTGGDAFYVPVSVMRSSNDALVVMTDLRSRHRGFLVVTADCSGVRRATFPDGMIPMASSPDGKRMIVGSREQQSLKLQYYVLADGLPNSIPLR